MASQQAAPAEWRIELPDEAATAMLARQVTELIGPGDVVTLGGDLGAGKSTLARAMIRFLCQDEALEVPSPTFTLMQQYECPDFPVVHADFYRIGSPDELVELGWDEITDGALTIIEWADRAGGHVPASRLDIELSLDPARGPQWRRAVLTGHGAIAGKLARMKGIDRLLGRSGWADAERSFMLGDASTRAYERLVKPDGQRAILMISPPRPDGPPVRFGKPYSAIARLAETITPFVAMAEGLRAHGLSAPEIYACDLDAGLAVLEDFGSEGVVDDNGPIPERYAQAVSVLAGLHGQALSEHVHFNDGLTYRIPPYDMDALLIEVELFTEWYASHVRAVLSSAAKAMFVNLWRRALEEIVAARPVWVLRDYHSPNLLWLPSREGDRRIGVIDFQDCVMGSPAYDVVSLLQDARVTVPADMELRLLGQYTRQRQAAEPEFDMGGFARAYALMGAQRATKILGIFARLNKRDGKPQYLAHMPRVSACLLRNLGHPALSDLKSWYESHMAHLFASS